MGKMVTQISASASVLKDAHEQIKAFPSGAEDRETDPQGREAKHFVQYVINHSQMELEATQAAGLVLNLSSAGGSDKVESETHFWAWDVVRLARLAEAAEVSETRPLDDTTFARAVDDEEAESEPTAQAEGLSFSNASAAADDSADFFDELEIARAVGDLPLDGPECGDDEGGELAGKADEEVDLLARVFGKTGDTENKIGQSRTYRAKGGEKIPVSDAHHYAYRDTRLFGFNAIEFKKFFRIREMTKKDEEWYAGEQARLEMERQDERRRSESVRKSGRPSYRFLLREPHPLHDSWIIVKKEKWGPLIPCGAPAPSDPGPPSSNPTDSEERKRRDFARYFVSILVPWDKDFPPELTYERWQEHVAELERDACLRRPLERDVNGKEVDGEARLKRLIAAGKLFDIENFVNGFKVTEAQRVLPKRHRERERTFWSKKNPKPTCRHDHGIDAKKRDAAKELNNLRRKADKLRGTQDVATRLKAADHAKTWTTSLKEALKAQAASRRPVGSQLQKLWASAAQPARRTVDGAQRDAAAVSKALLQPLPAHDDGTGASAGGGERATTHSGAADDAVWLSAGPFAPIDDATYDAAAAAHKAQLDAGYPVGDAPLNPEQRDGGRDFLAFAKLRKKARVPSHLGGSGATSKQVCDEAAAAGLSQVTLVDGAGGTGKSAMVHALQKQMDAKGLGHLLISAYTGVAAAPFGGPTLLKLLSLNIHYNNSKYVRYAAGQQKLKENREKFRKECGFSIEELGGVCIDEVSFNSTSLFGQLDASFRELLDEPDAVCGGLPIILMGDNFQKDPVGAPPWYRVLVESALGKCEELGDGPSSAIGRGVALLQSARRVTLKRLMRVDDGDPDAPAFREMQLSMRGTGAEQPVPGKLLARLRALSPADLAADEEWRFAPVGVLAHIEADAVNHSQLEAFAKAFGLPLIKWRLPMVDEIEDADKRDRLYAEEPGLWGYYVEGAPINITENIASVRKLVNGSAALLDSLEFQGSVPDEVINAYRRGGFCEIELDAPPFAVNVRVGGKKSPPGAAPGSAPGSVLWHGVELDDLSELIPAYADGDAQIVPLRVSEYKGEVKLLSYFAAQNNLPEAIQVSCHPYSISFALTDFKLQGKTLPKLILSICTRKHLPWMTLKAFYVLVSRVRNLSALRLLHHDEAALMKVSRVRHDEYLHAWDNGYDATGRWSPQRAVAAYHEAHATSEAIKARTKERVAAAKAAKQAAAARQRKAAAAKRRPAPKPGTQPAAKPQKTQQQAPPATPAARAPPPAAPTLMLAPLTAAVAAHPAPRATVAPPVPVQMAPSKPEAAGVTKRQQKCTRCGQLGHKFQTCKR